MNQLVNTFHMDVEYCNNHENNEKELLLNIKTMIKKYTQLYFTTIDDIQKKDIVDRLSRYYNMLYYIKGKKDSHKMFLLDRDIDNLPFVYVVQQKPELFEINNSLLKSIDVSHGLSLEQAQELLKFTVNNTRNNLNMGNKNRGSNQDVYDNDSLGGACGFSQFSSLYPLQKLGLTVTINNISSIGGCRHAYGTVIIPINIDGNIVRKRYLIDCTYRQFFTIPHNVVARYLNGTPEIGFFIAQDKVETEFAKKLLMDGFVEANEENLVKYLKPFYAMTLDINELTKLDKKFAMIDIISMLDNQQENFDYTEEEFLDWGMNLEINNYEKIK